MIAWYKFDNEKNIGADSSGNGFDAVPAGDNAPVIKEVDGRNAVLISGDGKAAASYLKLPENILKSISDDDGLCISFWMNLSKGVNVWERLFDFGHSTMGPYFFLTRNLRASCFSGADLLADPGKGFAEHTWMHVAVVVHGTKNGTLSSAGPQVYVDGELIADGLISQTSSGNYRRLREWFAGLKEDGRYVNNFIGRSQFDADPDANVALSDFRIYDSALSEGEIVDIVCESISKKDILEMVCEKYLMAPDKIITEDIELPTSYMGGKVNVVWKSEDESVLSSDGKVGDFEKAKYIKLSAILSFDDEKKTIEYYVTVVPKTEVPYELTIHADSEKVKISDTLYGLFYEDINNAADGGIYAELVNNRSFEAFTYNTYDPSSGENGKSTGRNHTPLAFWFGDTDKVTPKCEGGLNEHLGITKPDTSEYYITAKSGAVLYNRGFCDTTAALSMYLKKDEKYDFSIWAKSTDNVAKIKVSLVDEDDALVSDEIVLDGITDAWNKFGESKKLVLTAKKTGYAQLRLIFEGEISIDMVSLMPENVWGADEESTSATAHANYTGNKNYRLRRDLVEAMRDLHPKFLRFPGGCISEGSFIWENVYDWKDSVDDIEYRKENFNVWGYMMTMGLGYMEYFQLAEDLGASPLPVMACGVLCQARSDYANPAGGELQKKYIKNFTDLIDFAISTDCENNEWAALRKKMGHEKPFDMHLLGVGNENWGEEFFASFEEFKHAIDEHMEKNYPGYDLTIISTVGAQADDDAYKFGWRYLSGNLKDKGAVIAFTDGNESFDENVEWYKYQKHYMETVADEHYYRSNAYLYENADRYDYYYRVYKADGTIDDDNSSKVFVGEYASSDKNTLAGAVAEAAVMTGFENNSDVVRLAATAPLFNKVLYDGAYRWTPDAIWFDNDSVWRTPNYYVQQMFAKYIGDRAVETSFKMYDRAEKKQLIPHGGVSVSVTEADVLLQKIEIISNADGSVLFSQDFAKELNEKISLIPGSENYEKQPDGILFKATDKAANGIYIYDDSWTDYKVNVTAKRISGNGGLFVGAGLTDISEKNKNVVEYAVSMHGYLTGVRVFKDGSEGYRMGDYSSSELAGNLRECNFEPLEDGKQYVFTVNYGCGDARGLQMYYTDEAGNKSIVLGYKLNAYNRVAFNSVTRDEKNIYAKLVNKDNVAKKVSVKLDAYKKVASAEVVMLTADKDLAGVANVNTKEKEYVVPVKYQTAVNNQTAEILLPANSVAVVVF